jgi:uncharacterized protein (TIGR02271 family)
MSRRTDTTSPAAAAAPNAGDDLRVPVLEETAAVQRERTVTGRVRVQKRVSARVVPVDVTLAREHVRITRHRIEREVRAAPPVRHEGDTLIVPVVEERVVVEKRLFLREEIHVTRVHDSTHARKRVRLRSEEVEVERIDDGGADGADAAAPARTHRGRA